MRCLCTDPQNNQQNLNYERKQNKNEDSLRDHWEDIKQTNICIVGSQKEEREKGTENLFEEIMAENFPNFDQGNRYSSPGSTESPKHDEPKETHINTHCN